MLAILKGRFDKVIQKSSDRTSDTANLETGTNLRGQLALCATQDNIEEFLAGRHRRNLAVKQIKSASNPGGKECMNIEKVVDTHILPRRLHDGPQESSKEWTDSEAGVVGVYQVLHEKIVAGHFSAER